MVDKQDVINFRQKYDRYIYIPKSDNIFIREGFYKFNNHIWIHCGTEVCKLFIEYVKVVLGFKKEAAKLLAKNACLYLSWLQEIYILEDHRSKLNNNKDIIAFNDKIIDKNTGNFITPSKDDYNILSTGYNYNIKYDIEKHTKLSNYMSDILPVSSERDLLFHTLRSSLNLVKQIVIHVNYDPTFWLLLSKTMGSYCTHINPYIFDIQNGLDRYANKDNINIVQLNKQDTIDLTKISDEYNIHILTYNTDNILNIKGTEIIVRYSSHDNEQTYSVEWAPYMFRLIYNLESK